MPQFPPDIGDQLVGPGGVCLCIYFYEKYWGPIVFALRYRSFKRVECAVNRHDFGCHPFDDYISDPVKQSRENGGVWTLPCTTPFSPIEDCYFFVDLATPSLRVDMTVKDAAEKLLIRLQSQAMLPEAIPWVGASAYPKDGAVLVCLEIANDIAAFHTKSGAIPLWGQERLMEGWRSRPHPKKIAEYGFFPIESIFTAGNA